MYPLLSQRLQSVFLFSEKQKDTYWSRKVPTGAPRQDHLLLRSLAPHCSPAVSYPTRLLYPTRNHPPSRPPRLSPSPCHRSSRLSCSGAPSQTPGPHQRQGHCLAVGEAVEGLAHRALLARTAAKLEGGQVCEGEGPSRCPPLPVP